MYIYLIIFNDNKKAKQKKTALHEKYRYQKPTLKNSKFVNYCNTSEKRNVCSSFYILTNGSAFLYLSTYIFSWRLSHEMWKKSHACFLSSGWLLSCRQKTRGWISLGTTEKERERGTEVVATWGKHSPQKLFFGLSLTSVFRQE